MFLLLEQVTASQLSCQRKELQVYLYYNLKKVILQGAQMLQTYLFLVADMQKEMENSEHM